MIVDYEDCITFKVTYVINYKCRYCIPFNPEEDTFDNSGLNSARIYTDHYTRLYDGPLQMKIKDNQPCLPAAALFLMNCPVVAEEMDPEGLLGLGSSSLPSLGLLGLGSWSSSCLDSTITDMSSSAVDICM